VANGSIYPPTQPPKIGWANASDYFQGSVDDVRIYNRALSATEVARLSAGYPDAAAASTLTLAGSLALAGTLTQNAGTLDANGNSVTTTGLVTLNGGTYTASTALQSFNGGLTQYGGTFTGSSGDVDINGALTLNGGTFTAPFSGIFTLSGDFTNKGAFIPNCGLLTLDGGGQTLSGSTTFSRLAKTVGSALLFSATSTFTITDALTLKGQAAGSLLALRSTQGNTPWVINSSHSRSLQYLNVQDSANTSVILSCLDCSDSGNNTKWQFDTSPGTPTTTTTDAGSGGGGGGGGRRPSSSTASSASSAGMRSSSSASPLKPATSFQRSPSDLREQRRLNRLAAQPAHSKKPPIHRDISASPSPKTVTTNASVNVRSYYSMSGRILIQLPANTTVEVLSLSKNWARVKLPDGRTGYLMRKFLK
jgi:hypothetical protein